MIRPGFAALDNCLCGRSLKRMFDLSAECSMGWGDMGRGCVNDNDDDDNGGNKSVRRSAISWTFSFKCMVYNLSGLKVLYCRREWNLSTS